ncbi:hypothetical protein SAMN05892883_1894 [Jatrophihabitans sp. GAS493]|uniref:hypothetical protein n=1 Tax=Jatrophihabitans sp. GAS493 TaxID=1907575 RepID=UPI000BB9AF85|nr:hypothetical protein [Jatrophihabitans sp. GAS493]SOD72503.1 hypothetical protein SAMN05892883_1894 [Jatrophihabitans sp. GAS493]
MSDTPDDSSQTAAEGSTEQTARPAPSKPRDEKPVLPTVTRDESDDGWGERSSGGFSDDWYKRERPPHHG